MYNRSGTSSSGKQGALGATAVDGGEEGLKTTQIKITLVTGPMCAGKSATLIARSQDLNGHGFSYQCYRAALSERKIDNNEDNAKKITSRAHPNMSIKAIPLEQNFDAEKLIELVRKQQYHTIIIDEIQFLQLESLKKFIEGIGLLQTKNKHAQNALQEIILAGLDMDFKGEKFEQFNYINKIANNRMLLEARCSVEGCKAAATHSAKIGGNPNQQLEAGAEMYKACCYPHWKFLNKLLGVQIANNQGLEKTYLSKLEELEKTYKEAGDSIIVEFEKDAEAKDVRTKLKFNKNNHTYTQVK